jgi:hypothetical protein
LAPGLPAARFGGAAFFPEGIPDLGPAGKTRPLQRCDVLMIWIVSELCGQDAAFQFRMLFCKRQDGWIGHGILLF